MKRLVGIRSTLNVCQPYQRSLDGSVLVASSGGSSWNGSAKATPDPSVQGVATNTQSHFFPKRTTMALSMSSACGSCKGEVRTETGGAMQHINTLVMPRGGMPPYVLRDAPREKLEIRVVSFRNRRAARILLVEVNHEIGGNLGSGFGSFARVDGFRRRGRAGAGGARGERRIRNTVMRSSCALLQDVRARQSVRELVHQSHEDLSQGERMCLRCGRDLRIVGRASRRASV